MEDITIRYLPVLVAAIAGFILGALWYSPILFGNIWLKLVKVNKHKMNAKEKRGMVKSMIIMFILTLIMAWVLSHILQFAQTQNYVEGMLGAFWSWIGLIATTQLSGVLWLKKPIKLYAIDAGHYLVSLLVMGAILGGWQ